MGPSSWAFIPEEWRLMFNQKVAQDCSWELYSSCQSLEITSLSKGGWLNKWATPSSSVLVLKGIMLSRQSHPQHVTHSMSLFIKHPPNEEITNMENRWVVSRGQGGCRAGRGCGWKELRESSLWCGAVCTGDRVTQDCIRASVSNSWPWNYTVIMCHVTIVRNWVKGTWDLFVSSLQLPVNLYKFQNKK